VVRKPLGYSGATSNMIIAWWHWLALGLILIALELAASGGFYIIFFGVAAIVISLLVYLHAGFLVWLQLLLFSVLSVVCWMKLGREGVDVDSLVGENAVAREAIPPGGIGRVELRGTVWTARNVGSGPLTNGQRCAVVRADSLTLDVEAEGARA
jgi:inner membrane protein